MNVLGMAIVFRLTASGDWEVHDVGPSVALFCRYREGAAPAPLFLMEFDSTGWPSAGLQRRAD